MNAKPSTTLTHARFGAREAFPAEQNTPLHSLTHQETKVIPIVSAHVLVVHLVHVLSLPNSASRVLATELTQLLIHGIPTRQVPGKGIFPWLRTGRRMNAISSIQVVAQVADVIFICSILEAKHDIFGLLNTNHSTLTAAGPHSQAMQELKSFLFLAPQPFS